MSYLHNCTSQQSLIHINIARRMPTCKSLIIMKLRTGMERTFRQYALSRGRIAVSDYMGRTIRNEAPFPPSEVTRMEPLWSLIILFAMERPSPMPPFSDLVVKKESNILPAYSAGTPAPVSLISTNTDLPPVSPSAFGIVYTGFKGKRALILHGVERVQDNSKKNLPQLSFASICDQRPVVFLSDGNVL